MSLHKSKTLSSLIIKGGRITNCNDELLSLFGYLNKNEIIGKTPADLSPMYQNYNSLSEREAVNKIYTAIKEGENIFNWVHKRKDNVIFLTKVHLTRINNNTVKAKLTLLPKDVSIIHNQIINHIEGIRNNQEKGEDYYKLLNIINAIFN